MAEKVTAPEIRKMKQRGEKITALTAYDYSFARILDEAGVDILLVGDSLGMVIQGEPNTLSVKIEHVIYHCRAVSRAAQHAHVVADMPFMSFQVSPRQALKNAGRLIKEGGAHAVKLEGGVKSAAKIAAIAGADIPVMGHVGLTPQSLRRLGGFRVQRDEGKLLDDALATEKAGAFALVIECVPADLAQKVTAAVKIPTIGIGAGPGCDGQVQVLHDMLGLFTDFVPKHAKQYARLAETVQEAFCRYAQEVREGTFPTGQESFTMDEGILRELEAPAAKPLPPR